MTSRAGVCLGAWLLVAAEPLFAHDGPHEVIAALNQQIAENGATSRRLIDRAYEHRALGHWPEALADFQAALRLQPDDSAALRGAVQTMLHLGKLAEAETLAYRALAQFENNPIRPAGWALLAQIQMRQQKHAAALASWRQALESPQPQVDWWLGEAECLAALDRQTERVLALEQAMKRNSSVVLQRAWVDALVEAGALDSAAREIERGLATARWRSAWLILRARVAAQRRDFAAARADARSAIEEIEARLAPRRPDPWLLAEAAEARAVIAAVTDTKP